MSTEEATPQNLESELGELLDQETVRPARRFRRQRARHRRVAARGGRQGSRCLVAEAGRRARLVHRADAGPRRLQPAVLQVVRRRQDQRLAQLPRPPHRGRDRRPRRLLLARRGGGDARGHLRRSSPRRSEARQRPEGPRRRGRRRRRHLSADDPRGRRRDARLRADRRAAQRRLRRLLAGRRQGADAVLRGQGADHRRRARRKGKTRRDQAGRRRRSSRTCRRSRR